MLPIIYHYHPATGELLGAGQADPSPAEQDVWLIPAHATDVEPPAAVVHEAAVFHAGEWSVRPDWRGVPLFAIADGAPLNITSIGQVPADIGATEQPRPSSYHHWQAGEWLLDAAAQLRDDKAAASLAITAERDRLEAAGFPYRGKVFDSDPRSVQRITSAALAAQSAKAGAQPLEIEWAAADNSLVLLDADGLLGMPVALASYAAALHATARERKTAIDATDTVEQIDAILAQPWH